MIFFLCIITYIQDVPWHIWIFEQDHAFCMCIFATSSNVFADTRNLSLHCMVLYNYYSYHLPHVLPLPLVYVRMSLVPLIVCRTVSKKIIVKNVKKRYFFRIITSFLIPSERIYYWGTWLNYQRFSSIAMDILFH